MQSTRLVNVIARFRCVALGTDGPFPMIGKGVSRAAVTPTLDAIIMDQSTAGRINPLLIAEIAKEMLCNLGFGEARLTGYERQDVVCKRHVQKHTRSNQEREAMIKRTKFKLGYHLGASPKNMVSALIAL
jgi:hypothetical protein